MKVKLLTEQHLEFVSLKGGCTGSSESTYVKIPHCWKSHVMAQFIKAMHDKTAHFHVHSDDSEQPGHPPSLIIVFAPHMKKYELSATCIFTTQQILQFDSCSDSFKSLRNTHAIVLIMILLYVV